MDVKCCFVCLESGDEVLDVGCRCHCHAHLQCLTKLSFAQMDNKGLKSWDTCQICKTNFDTTVICSLARAFHKSVQGKPKDHTWVMAKRSLWSSCFMTNRLSNCERILQEVYQWQKAKCLKLTALQEYENAFCDILFTQQMQIQTMFAIFHRETFQNQTSSLGKQKLIDAINMQVLVLKQANTLCVSTPMICHEIDFAILMYTTFKNRWRAFEIEEDLLITVYRVSIKYMGLLDPCTQKIVFWLHECYYYHGNIRKLGILANSVLSDLSLQNDCTMVLLMKIDQGICALLNPNTKWSLDEFAKHEMSIKEAKDNLHNCNILEEQTLEVVKKLNLYADLLDSQKIQISDACARKRKLTSMDLQVRFKQKTKQANAFRVDK